MNQTSYKLENICVFGMGGVGGYFGGRIAHYLESFDLTVPKIFFIARGAHLEAIKANGLILNTVEKKGMICRPTLATDSVRDLPVPDLCLLCVKGYDLEDAVIAVKDHIGEDTLILPLLNGADVYDRIRTHLESGIVLPSCAYVGTHVETMGVVTQTGGGGIILSGNDPKSTDIDPTPIIDLFKKAGIDFKWNPDPFPAIWEKFIFIAGYGLITADTGMTLGEVLENEAAREATRSIMGEIVEIARIRQICLPDNIVTISMEKAKNFPHETKTSFQRDVEAKGKQNEGDLFGGAVIRLGKSLNVPTPITETVFARIQEGLA